MQWQPVQGSQPLAPFDHQVAGQSSMLRYDTTTVCKPLIPRENFVYKTLPEELKNFTPEYRGEIEVQLKEENGFIQLYGVPVASEIKDTDYPFITDPHHPSAEYADVKSQNAEKSEENGSVQRCMIRVLRSGSYEVCPSTGEVFCSKDSNPNHQRTLNLNPWSLKNHKRLLDKMRKSDHSGDKICFMLLKNVVADFRHPCILDLKIGSRLHGDDASSKKVESQSNKCRQTTSSTLSLRLCGMQVYQADLGVYHSIDKYHGRTLKADSFRDTLHGFLHNGIHFRSELLPPIVSKLSELIQCLQGLSSYRFYASSLLIIYDGDTSGDFIHQETKGDDSLHCLPKESTTATVQDKLPDSSQDVSQTDSGKSETLHRDDSNIYHLSSSLKSSTSNENKKSSPSSTVTLEPLTVSEGIGTNISKASDSQCCDKKPVKSGIQGINSSQFVSAAVVKEKYKSGEVPTVLDCTNSSLTEPHSSQNVPSKLSSLTDTVNSNHYIVNSSDMASTMEKTGPIDNGNHQGRSKWDQNSGDDNAVWLNSHLSNKQVSSQISAQIKAKREATSEKVSLLDHDQNSKSKTKDLSKSEHLYVNNSNDLQQHSQQRNDKHTDFVKLYSQDLDSQLQEHPVESASDLYVGSEMHKQFPPQQKERLRLNSNHQPSSTEAEELSSATHNCGASSSRTEAAEGKKLSGSHQNDHQIPALSPLDFHPTNGEVKVDVKMIDFAHTTHQGFTSDRVKHTGPDMDYICGLQNLMRLFRQLQEDR